MKTDSQNVVRMAELVIHRAELEVYISLLKEEIEASMANEPGVLMLHAVSITDEPWRIRILEVYASQADYLSHLQTSHFLKYKTLTAGMVASLDLVQVDAIALCAK